MKDGRHDRRPSIAMPTDTGGTTMPESVRGKHPSQHLAPPRPPVARLVELLRVRASLIR
ncbi:MAG: hypothetical protein ABF811_07480 [Pseudoclavibacter sp.]|jgi:hypothetical protein